jgi:phosphatidylethanolamine-binding protein (PEBP) family uncharacterized protein
MEINYNNKVVNKQHLTIKETQIPPVVSLSGLDTNKKYTLIMYDPNAVGGSYIHWIVSNIIGNNFNTGKDIVKYYGPHPPKGTGLHTYIFSLYELNTDINRITPNKRQSELIELGIRGQPIYTNSFISQHNEGGKCNKKFTKKKKNKRNKSVKKRRKY